MTQIPDKRVAIESIVRSIFKLDGEPFPITPGQIDIFEGVTNPKHKNVWISAPTRYGKSEILGMGLSMLAASQGLKIPIVAGSTEKAKKIMDYIVLHLGDHPSLYEGLINLDASAIERLKVQKSQDTLRWADGGWIFVTSLDSRSISKEGETVVGEGGDVVVLEEAGLIRHMELLSKVVRMSEGHIWNKLILNGNCIEGSVHERAYKDPKYHKIRIPLQQAIDEGRFTQEEIDKKKEDTTLKDWKRYYLVEFPKENEFTYFKPHRYEILPNKLKYYGAIDPALGESRKGSRTAIVVIGVDEETGQRYEVESIVKKMTPDEAIIAMFNLPYEFSRFAFEAIMFQKYFLKETKKKANELGKSIPFEGITHQKSSKLERIESLEPIINTKNILFKGENQLWQDMQEYPETEYLDGLDALEMANRVSIKKPPAFSIGGEDFA